MEHIIRSFDELIGHTPLMALCNLEREHHLNARVLAKLESFNPAGSAKDRVAKSMIDDAEQKGLLKPGATTVSYTHLLYHYWISVVSNSSLIVTAC